MSIKMNGKLTFASAFNEKILSKSTFVLKRNDKNYFDILVLEDEKAYPCGVVMELAVDDDIQDLSVLIGKYPKRVPSKSKFPEFELEMVKVEPLKNGKTKDLINKIKENLNGDMKLLHKTVRELSNITNMNRDMFVLLSRMYDNNRQYEYRNTLRVFLNQFN